MIVYVRTMEFKLFLFLPACNPGPTDTHNPIFPTGKLFFQPIYGHRLLTMVDLLQVAHMCEFLVLM